MSRRAVFLDRDGVLNRNVWYPDTGAWESPRRWTEFQLAQGVLPALASLRDAGYLLFLVSNQPNVAKGKSPPGELEAMHGLLTEQLAGARIALAEAFYCVHHPEFTGPCLCRKPSPYFLNEAARVYELSLSECWIIGDRSTDVACGRAAGVRTVWVRTGQEHDVPDSMSVDIWSKSLPDAANQILAHF